MKKAKGLLIFGLLMMILPVKAECKEKKINREIDIQRLVHLMMKCEDAEEYDPSDVTEAFIIADRLDLKKESNELQKETVRILKEIMKELTKIRNNQKSSCLK
ncbi:MAG: hypothetical protein RR733_04840 [Victivallaceae bacterium]